MAEDDARLSWIVLTSMTLRMLACVRPLTNRQTTPGSQWILFFFFCFVSLGWRDHVQHRPPRLATSGQGALGEHLGWTDDIQPPTGGDQVTLWQRRRTGLGASPQRPGFLRGGKPRRLDEHLLRPLSRENRFTMLTAVADSRQITSVLNYGGKKP